MNEDSFEDWYNKSAVDIWQRYGKNQQLVPLLLPRIDTNVDVLFLGMNPSHRLEWIKNQINQNPNEFNNFTIDELFSWDANSIFKKMPYIKLMEEKARTQDKLYYGALEKFTRECQFENWTHLDLFLIRETEQNQLIKLIQYDEKSNYINEFGQQQVNLFKQALDKINPKFIVVNNATTSVFLSKFLVGEKITQTKIIYKNIPVFLGGMLSGQRSMDRFSRLRLINEIKQSME